MGGSLRYCDRKKRGCVCLMPEKSTVQVFYVRVTNGWKERPISQWWKDKSRERNAKRPRWRKVKLERWNGRSVLEWDRGREGWRWSGWRWSGTLNVEVKAGRSRPRVEWSSPGRRRAFSFFLGVHGQLEPLKTERRKRWIKSGEHTSQWLFFFFNLIYTQKLHLKLK